MLSTFLDVAEVLSGVFWGVGFLSMYFHSPLPHMFVVYVFTVLVAELVCVYSIAFREWQGICQYYIIKTISQR